MSTFNPMLRRWLAVALWAAVLLSALYYRHTLVAWFTGQPTGSQASLPAAAGPHDHAQPPPGVPSQPLPPQALEYARAALGATEQARAKLAADSLEGLEPLAREVAQALRQAATGLGPDMGASLLQSGAEAAERLATAREPAQARKAFGDLSRALVALAMADERLRQGWSIFECPMEEGFNKWVQREGALENPYMGQQMLACGRASEWKVELPAAPTGEVAHYTCPMHTSVKQSTAGRCPICGMDLVAVTREELETGTVLVDSLRRQRIGVKTTPVKVSPMDLSVQALGRVVPEETALVDVTLKVDGYIHKLYVEATGQPVRRGQTLFTLYSPELYAAQQEWLLALRSQQEARQSGAPERVDSLVESSRRRLQLWGVSEAQLEELAAHGKPLEHLAFPSPASGYVLEKRVVEGAAVRAGEPLFRIAPLDKVWVEAEVYEQDLPRVKPGLSVEVSLPYLPGRAWQGRISYVYPVLQAGTRTGRIRVELANPGLELKPDMYAEVKIKLQGGPRLQVPASAVLYTGPRRLVFVDLGGDRLAPREVKLGARSGESFEVLEGLKEGEVVVVSGNFLIAAESRIRSAAAWEGSNHESH
jgi:membrane fusion protein, copper/silver efflux system